MTRKVSICIVFLFFLCITNAQDAAKEYEKLINRMSPLSPNVASLGKYGEVPVNLYTGIPSIDIPVTTITSGNLSLPVSLSYHAGGIRVEETPSWVGLGWSLNAGGIITRQMRGAPDEGGTIGGVGAGGILNNPLTINQYLDSAAQHGSLDNYPAFRQMLTDAANGQADLEPDIFYYNVAGLSGKFVYDENTVKFISQSDKPVQINYSKNESLFEIINDEGTRYQFGITEQSRSYIYSSENTARANYTTGWYLTRIINANSTDTITFVYDNSNLSFYTLGSGFRKNILTYTTDVSIIPQDFAKDPFMNSFTTGFVLSSIISRSGKIVFERDTTDRQDLAGDKALKKIWVYDKQNNLVNSFSMDYDYFVSTSSPVSSFIGGQYLKRLKLLAFNEMGKDYTNTAKWKKHTFTYNETTMLPSRLSYGQDYWGYYNGRENATLVPKAVYVASTGKIVDLPGADRYIDAAYTQANMLTSITYPTGGKTEFTYEANRVPYAEMNAALPTPTKWFVHQLSALAESYLDLQDTYSTTFTINQPPDKYINGGQGGVFVKLEINPQCGNELAANCAGFTVTGPVSVAVPQNSSGFYLPNGTYTMTANLVPLKQRVNSGEQGFVDAGNFLFAVSYLGVDSSNLQGPNADVLVGGVRIQKMVNTDPVSGNTLVKTFRYIKSNGTSSGWTLSVINHSYTERLVYNIYVNVGAAGHWETLIGDYLVRTSGSSAPMLNTQGNSTGYSRVEEYTADNNNNGRAVHIFSHQNHFVDLDASNQYPFPPPFDADWERGVSLSNSTEAYNSAAFVPVNQSSYGYNYWYHDTASNSIKGIKSGFDFRSIYAELDGAGLHTTASPAPDEARNWQPYAVATGGYWQYADTTVTYNETASQHITVIKEMERNPLNQKPAKVTTYQSNGKVKREWLKYPVDGIYSSTLSGDNQDALVSMKTKNMIGVPVLDSVTIDNQPAYLSYITFKQQGNRTLLDRVIESKTGNSADLQQMLKVNAYDNNDNMLEAAKYSDPLQSTLWGYNNNYPIAKAINAASGEIFYDGFEEAGTWNGMVYDATKWHTGKNAGRIDNIGGSKIYYYSNKWLTVTATSGRKWKYSGWVYSNGPSVQLYLNMKRPGETGSASYTDNISGTITGQWIFLEKEFEVPADVTQLNIRVDNNGGGTVWFDDIRLHPADAQMLTYTYDPLVGLTSQSDIQNVATLYEYDSFNRLLRIRDKDGFVAKQYDYQYQQVAHNNPIWQVTGNLRCKPCPANASYPSNIQQQEEKDTNPNSATYDQTRWTDNGVSSSCVVSADWQNTATAIRCRLAAGANTGEQEREQEDKNPCSNTYSQTRWIVIATNTTACPLPCNSSNCSGVDKKCISGTCSTGIKVYTSTVQDANGWTCTYHYEWSDGSWSANYIEYSSIGCIDGISFPPGDL